MHKLFTRVLPQPRAASALLAGLGGVVAIGFLAWATEISGTLLLMAPFGATCVLLFSAPSTPLSQPANVVGGHVIAALVGLIMAALLPDTYWAVALAVGTAITAMSLLRVTHPPAGANPIVVFASDPNWLFLLFPVLTGAVLLVVIGLLYNRLNKIPYPVFPK
ncbi:HPP family protein [Cognatishimia sp. WU-CL00825]|uniref:HPP family protein n=1 Tax=Cognatishimia sp. WU-CL00825 TaxID=3127658 RepID=UPI00310B5DF3